MGPHPQVMLCAENPYAVRIIDFGLAVQLPLTKEGTPDSTKLLTDAAGTQVRRAIPSSGASAVATPSQMGTPQTRLDAPGSLAPSPPAPPAWACPLSARIANTRMPLPPTLCLRACAWPPSPQSPQCPPPSQKTHAESEKMRARATRRVQAYRAPEISNAGYDPAKVDVWALGIVTFSLASGFFPVQVRPLPPTRGARGHGCACAGGAATRAVMRWRAACHVLLPTHRRPRRLRRRRRRRRRRTMRTRRRSLR